MKIAGDLTEFDYAQLGYKLYINILLVVILRIRRQII